MGKPKKDILRRIFPEIPMIVLSVAAIIGLPFLYLKLDEGARRKRFEYFRSVENLVNMCNKKTAGEDGVISSKEGEGLAKGLGYAKVIYPGEEIILRNQYARSGLFIGCKTEEGLFGPQVSYRDFKEVSREDMMSYLDI